MPRWSAGLSQISTYEIRFDLDVSDGRVNSIQVDTVTVPMIARTGLQSTSSVVTHRDAASRRIVKAMNSSWRPA